MSKYTHIIIYIIFRICYHTNRCYSNHFTLHWHTDDFIIVCIHSTEHTHIRFTLIIHQILKQSIDFYFYDYYDISWNKRRVDVVHDMYYIVYIRCIRGCHSYVYHHCCVSTIEYPSLPLFSSIFESLFSLSLRRFFFVRMFVWTFISLLFSIRFHCVLSSRWMVRCASNQFFRFSASKIKSEKCWHKSIRRNV